MIFGLMNILLPHLSSGGRYIATFFHVSIQEKELPEKAHSPCVRNFSS